MTAGSDRLRFHVRCWDGVPSDGWLIGTVEAGTVAVGQSVEVRSGHAGAVSLLRVAAIDRGYRVRPAVEARSRHPWVRVYVPGLVGRDVLVGTILESPSADLGSVR